MGQTYHFWMFLALQTNKTVGHLEIAENMDQSFKIISTSGRWWLPSLFGRGGGAALLVAACRGASRPSVSAEVGDAADSGALRMRRPLMTWHRDQNRAEDPQKHRKPTDPSCRGSL
jgi:hypothetical protein